MRNYKEIDIDYEAAVRLSDYADDIHVSYRHDNSGSWYCYQNSIFHLCYDNNFYHKHNHDKIERDDLALIIEVVKSKRAKFEKRLQAYWKRYGASKLRTWTYWAD